MLTNNRTPLWLSSKTPKECEDLMKKACCISLEFKWLYRMRRQKLLEEQANLLQAKKLQLDSYFTRKEVKRERRFDTKDFKLLLMAVQKSNLGRINQVKSKKEKTSTLKL